MNLVGNRLALAQIGDRTNQKVIGERGYVTKIEEAQVEGFSGFGGASGREPIALFVRQNGRSFGV